MANYDSYGFNKDKTKYDLTQISAMIEEQVQNGFKNLLNAAWPIGSVYLSADGSTPSARGLPGTWEKLPAGYYLGTHTGVSAGSTGGSNSFKLTAAQIPPHAHAIVYSSTDLGDQYAPFRRIRFIDGSTGGTSGKSPATLPMNFTVRRGYGESTTCMNESGILTKTPNGGSDTGKVISVQDQASGKDAHWDLFEVNFTNKCKIDGWTSDGIYNETAYNNKKALTQQAVTYSPQYIHVDAYKRKS